ncbi:Uncharacterized protein PECH_000876 [Penicillium ucsense]|uniref:DOC domain-containing protein n=1 Tax=Penicillium ucsense TaxID=2839758 RepID=A0A8J8VY15_9EURO|nr:Uncharacterized protein PECM_000656 [Penicillium ucsense]KAF7733269.1 Uncharacterized protein PECH_000876 [Penicillium ucsense]
MPQLRRQPNLHGYHGDPSLNEPNTLRAQFQTPPSRDPRPDPPTHWLPPSSGPQLVTPELAPVSSPPNYHAAMPNGPFAMFRRQRPGRQVPEPAMQEEDVFEDDSVLNVDADEHVEYEDEMRAEDSFDHGEGLPGSEDIIDEEEDEEDDELDEDQYEDEDQEDEEDGDEEMQDREVDRSESPLPPNLREISSLASWTVSTSKPGCGVAALRHPSPSQYWQSDGPQPHTLTLHFFKLVAIVRIRVYLDFELDESYTPTKMAFLAGMGGNDLVQFATWEGDTPCGWVTIPLDGVGGRNGGWVREDMLRRKRRSSTTIRRHGAPRQTRSAALGTGAGGNTQGLSADEGEYGSEPDDYTVMGDPEDAYSGNVLKAMVLQMRVLENHQNGKDTHVRGFQVFACDDHRRRVGVVPSIAAAGHPPHDEQSSAHRSRRGNPAEASRAQVSSEDVDTSTLISTTGLHEPEWMGEPVIR